MFKAGQIDATTAMTMLAQATSASSGSAAPVVGGGDLAKGVASKKRPRSPTPEKSNENDDDDGEIDPSLLEPASHLDTFLCC